MPPIKATNITNRVLYKNSHGTYRMFSTTKTNYCDAGKYLGKIRFSPKQDTLYISTLKSQLPEHKEARVGTSLINFAKKMSKKLGLKGNLDVVAYNSEYKGTDPHKFYRKMGFTTNKKELDEMLDFCINYKIDIPPFYKQGLSMYYRPNQLGECKKI